MKNFTIKNIFALMLLLSLAIVSCDDRDDEITSLDFDRVFSPTGMEARLSKVVELTLKWKDVKGAQSYIVELYKDSLKFEAQNLVYTAEVLNTEFKYVLEGDMQYSARVKSVSDSIDDSKWNGIAFKTSVNSLYLDPQIGDIGSTEIILRWPAGTYASRVVLTPASGTAITHTISQEEVNAGVIKLTGLSPETTYRAILYGQEKQKIGDKSVTTLKEGTKFIGPDDDLIGELAAANEGAAFLLLPGNYLTDGTVLNITKSVSISGADINNKPIIHAQFDIESINSLDLKSLIMDGTKSDNTLLDNPIRFATMSGTYGNITIDGCEIRNYEKSLVAEVSGMLGVIESVKINNSIITNILTNGADGIDIRKSLLKKLTLTNSTFNNVAAARDFIRVDNDGSTTHPGNVDISIENCTLYKVSNTSGKRLLYVRFKTNTISVKNTIIAETVATFTNQSATSQPECSKNNYFNAPNFIAPAAPASGVKYDISGNHTTLDPQFEDAAAGNFKVKNPNVNVGDPRWID